MTTPAKITRFEDLIVFQKALFLSKEIYRVTSGGRFAWDRGLRDQIRNASVSILSNIAEGFGKYSNKEFKKYLAIANGSSFEVKAQLLLAREIGYLQETEVEALIRICEEVSRLLRALRRKMGE
jgi:four helix bundle protein